LKDIKAVIQENKWIEQELFHPGTVEHSIWMSNAPKRDLVTRWVENLEILQEAGIYTEPVNTIFTYVTKRMKTAGMDSAVHWARQSVDAKYKNESQNRGNQWTDEIDASFPEAESSSLASDLLAVEANNRIYISFLIRTIKELKKAAHRLAKDVTIQPEIPENEQEQFFLIWDNWLMKHREAWDGREKVLTTQQYIMAYCLSNFSLNHSYTKYLQYAKERYTLTPKQAGKLERLQVKKIQDVFDPKTFEEAVDLGFRGQQCPRCNSWRTDRRYNSDGNKDELFCFAEHHKDVSQWSPLILMKFNEVRI